MTLPATLDAARSMRDLPFGSQAQIAIAGGTLGAFLALIDCSRKNATATYAVRMHNDTPNEVCTRLWCVTRSGEFIPAYPRELTVPPFCHKDEIVPVRLSDVGHFERAVLDVRSADTQFTVEAPAPRRGSAANLGKTIALSGALLAACCGAGIFAVPRIQTLDAPALAFAGRSFDVPYVASGIGTIAYQLLSKNGAQISAGLTSARSGMLHFSIAPRPDDAPYTLHVRMQAPFGAAERVATIGISGSAQPKQTDRPPDRAMGPLIENLAVDSAAPVAGNAIGVTYTTSARGGEVSLVDEDGRTWADAPIDVQGRTVLAVPQAAAGRSMRVVVHAIRGHMQTISSLGVTVLPSTQIATTSATAAPKASAAPRKPARSTLPALVLSADSGRAGETVIVSVRNAGGDVHIQLLDGSGTMRAEGDPALPTAPLALRLPAVETTSTYQVVATITTGGSEQSVVRPIVVHP